MRFRVIDGCPVPASIAPYIAIVLHTAGQQASSIYRGTDARAILERHGKHDQAWLYANLPAGVANPPGRSSHELRSDGVSFAGPIGRRLEEWQVGVDSGADTAAARDHITRAAAAHGWVVKHPYSAGVELHHWNWAKRPRPRGLKQRLRIVRLRASLPRR